MYKHEISQIIINHPAGINLLKVNIRNTLYDQSWRRGSSAVFIVNFEYISHLALVFLLITLNM